MGRTGDRPGWRAGRGVPPRSSSLVHLARRPERRTIERRNTRHVCRRHWLCRQPERQRRTRVRVRDRTPVSASAWLPLALGVSCSLVALPAGAAISAQIPAECGSLSEFENELEQRLGDLATSDSAHVTLTPESSGYQLVVEAANQRRELHDANCQELLRAAVVITLALLEPKREQVAPPAAAPAPEVPAPPAPAAPKAERGSHPKFGLAAGGGLHVGTL